MAKVFRPLTILSGTVKMVAQSNKNLLHQKNVIFWIVKWKICKGLRDRMLTVPVELMSKMPVASELSESCNTIVTWTLFFVV